MTAPASSCTTSRALGSAFAARPSVFSYEAADLALAFIDRLPALLASLLSRALPSSPSGVALLAILHPPTTGVDEPLRTRVVRTRVQLECFEILGLVFAQKTIQILRG